VPKTAAKTAAKTVDAATRRAFRDLLAIFRQSYPHITVTLAAGRAADFPAARDHAYAQRTGPGRVRVTVAPRMAAAGDARRRGLLAHELAHAALLSADLDHSEAEADAVAAAIFGRTIAYDRDDVQTWDTRAPGARQRRPRYLPTGMEP